MIARNDSRPAVLAPASPEPTPQVPFHSGGRMLVLGSGERATRAAAELADALDCYLVADATTRVPERVASFPATAERPTLSGFLGRFVAILGDGRDLGALLDTERPYFDLVLDLGEEPAFAREWGPPGYFRPESPAAFARALDELRALIGPLEKPKFFALEATICAHGLPGTEGCRRCLDVCPADAIASLGGKIQVDANLCQGGGACATTCPTGALTYQFPPRVETLAQLERRLAAQRATDPTESPVVVFVEAATALEVVVSWPARAIAFEVFEVASIGMETWLSVLAMGAAAARILRPAQLAGRLVRALDEQLEFAHAILAGLGYPAGALGWLEPGEDPLAGAELAPRPPQPLSTATSKRGVLFAALDGLRAAAPSPADLIALPVGAPFGQLHVDHAACTTCLACAFVCPTRALSSGPGALPKLLFVEAACVSCGLCVSACPEDALDREPRLLLDQVERLEPRVLHMDEPYLCVVCGKPFATAGSVRAVVEMLADHPMFTKAGHDVLKTCDACRLQF